jgi:DNA-binding LacI/PurR family transcriptional regulator
MGPDPPRRHAATRGGRRRAATIGDVARLAGVSTATVSRVLAGVDIVRPETRARVRSAAADLGYRPSRIARSLKLQTTRTLGLIVTDIENPFFPQLVRAIEDAARSKGFAVLLCNAADNPEREAEYLELLVERRVDGIVIAASGLGSHHPQWLADPPVPVVLVNSVPDGTGLPAIASDNLAGGRAAVEHLLGLGHRRIGHVTALPRNIDAPERLAGAQEAIDRAARTRQHGLGGAKRQPPSMAIATGDPVIAGGEAATRELLTRDLSLTAIFAYNDLMAIGAMRALRTSGYLVPRDVSVIGFDDVAFAEAVDPPLTTLAQSTAEMGRWAFERIERWMVDGSGPAARELVRLPVRLVVRASTAPPRA